MADEINRASPRTQSALLQAMQEREVTIAGQHRPLGRPFHVLATQNPIEQEGTYPLPEAQLDRFLVQVDVDYPDRATERDILIATTGAEEAQVHQVFTAEELIAAQSVLRRMPVGDQVVEMILDLVRACRPGEPEGRGAGRCAELGSGPARGAGADADGAGAGAAGRAAGAQCRRCARAGAAGDDPPDGADLCRPGAGRGPGRASSTAWSRGLTGLEAAA